MLHVQTQVDVHGQLVARLQQDVHVQGHVVEPPLGELDGTAALQVITTNLGSHSIQSLHEPAVGLLEKYDSD